jgi:Ni/Co efflux regulator RcnB
MATPALTLPPRCQVWFKYGDDYFIADSDSDRQVRVYRRTLKP